MEKKEKQVRYALIGCGRVSFCHIDAALRSDVEIVALCDIDIEKARALAEKYGISVACYADYKEMLEKEQIDLIAIATDHNVHAEIAMYALSHKKHVMVEKPIALSLREADEMIALAKENGVKLTVCHQNRFNKPVQKVREALEQGKFGKIYHGTAHARWNRSDDYYRLADWRGTWWGEGGSLITQCIHNIDLLIWMLGSEATEVYASVDRVRHHEIEIDDLALGIIKFKNGAYGTVESSTNIYPTDLEGSMCIFGETGTAKTGGYANNSLEYWCFADDQSDFAALKEECNEIPPTVYGFGHIRLYQNMVSCIQNGGEPYISGLDGKKALEIIFAMYQSAKTHAPVALPLDESFRSTDFEGLLPEKK